MTINKQYISKKNTNSAPNKPKYIVIHETDNFRVGANGLTHATAQYKGHLNTSVHFYCGDDGVYQVADYTSSCWSIGKTYSNTRPIMDATNYNVISIEICVNADGNYKIARDNAIALTKFLMGDLGITEDRVIRHYDAKGKYCPRKMMDDPSLWVDFKNQIGSKAQPIPSPIQPTPISEYYRVGRDWQNGICVGQIGAFKDLENAKRVCSVGYNVYDGQGSIVYTSTPTPIPAPTPKPQPVQPTPQPSSMIRNYRVGVWQSAMNVGFDLVGNARLVVDNSFGAKSQAFANTHQLHKDIKGCPTAVKWLQKRLLETGLYTGAIDGKFGNGTYNAVVAYQRAKGLSVDGYVGLGTTTELLR